MRGHVKDKEPAATYCEGSHKTLDVIPNYVGGRGKCGFWLEDMRPKHPPGLMRFTFAIKYPDICQIAWHPIPVGTRCRFFGTKLVCVKHA